MLVESAKRAASVVKPTEKVWSLSYIPPAQIFMEIPTHINKKIELLLLLSVCRKYVFESTPAVTCHDIS